MSIISVSRRTDIPAYYAEWFVNRVREGYVRWPNPYGGRPNEQSLRREDVFVVVFWSKNYEPLLPYLTELDRLGWGFCFQYTITGLPTIFEPQVPPAEVAVKSARHLADQYGPEAVLWRYDPIVISDTTDARYHLSRFKGLASSMEGTTRRCYFSFPNIYAKVARNLGVFKEQTGITVTDPTQDAKLELSEMLADIAAGHGITMYSCCGDYLISGKILKAHCVDAQLIQRLYPSASISSQPGPTRKDCGCYKSKDIGVYGTCPHGCVYCYANVSKETALKNYRDHHPDTDMLSGDSGSVSTLAAVANNPQTELPFS